MREKPCGEAFLDSFKFARTGWDQTLADINRFSLRKTCSCYLCLVLYHIIYMYKYIYIYLYIYIYIYLYIYIYTYFYILITLFIYVFILIVNIYIYEAETIKNRVRNCVTLHRNIYLLLLTVVLQQGKKRQLKNTPLIPFFSHV